MKDPIEIVIRHRDGHEGFGYYVWEVDAEDEGYVYFSEEKPTIEYLKENICPAYEEAL